ncbi:DNA glycosylase AlkZ-like family protein [Paenibacillus rhizophilus]|uniref:Winged helix DNA-binding domain-containing protein n=1 Tax=Paenibacillus rhizophilus TaxID=1850366 RepID=A0A3N9PAI9_9BACL|nr:crosslink repair DNA glycosylase YcaQ family protein [Paenibacillus rhizophilus]RQW13233.1 winged helix DNA-binding domain-containing protein [Paenibacillus rhizophilus]
MISYKVSKRQAAQFLLKHQRLGPYRLPSGKESVYRYIRHVNCIQYDPLNIAGHNHELVLQARIPGFTPGMAQELLYQDRLLLDGWDKNMSIYCTEDWPYFRRLRDSAAARYGSNEAVMAMVHNVRAEIAERGPLSSLDMGWKDKVDWAWAPARLSRAALESMYFWGELSVHHRVHTRRYYDFAANLLPKELLAEPEPNPSEESYQEWYVLRRIGAIGLLWNRAGDGWLGISNIKSADRAGAIQRLLLADSIREVRVEGIKPPLFIRTSDAPDLETILKCKTGESPFDSGYYAAALAPLDNLIWDRELIRQLFGFQYRWEVYKPAGERQYGYYVLPLLYGDRFAARFEPVMDKATGDLILRNWWWEAGEGPHISGLMAAAKSAVSTLARSLGALRITVPPAVAAQSGIGEWDGDL